MTVLAFKVYRNGELLGVETFERDIVKIGRLSSAHLRLEDEKVSRIHAVVEISAAGEINIIDMGSSEGTWVNGQKVNKSALKVGDEIRVGDTRLVLQDGSAGVEASLPAAAPKDAAVLRDTIQAEKKPGRSEAPLGRKIGAEPAPTKATTPANGMPMAAAPVPSAAQVPLAAQVTLAVPASPPMAAPQPKARASSQSVEIPASPSSSIAFRRVALPPPRSLPDLRDDPTVSNTNWSLEVRKLWGDTVLDVRNFNAGEREVRIGEDKKAHFFFPAKQLPAPLFPVAWVVGSDVMLSFPSRARGEIVGRDGAVTDLSSVARSGKASSDPRFSECRTFKLPEGSVTTIRFGSVGLRLKMTSRAAGYLSRFSEHLDYTYLNTLLLILFVFGALMATLHLRPKSIETSEEELFKVPDRFVQFILTRPKPQKKDLNFLEKLKADINAKKEASAERHKGAEGKMGLTGKPDTGKRSAVRAIKPDDKEVVSNKGLLAVLGAGGPQGLSTVTGGNGLGGELEGAIGNLGGPAIGDSGGFGGLGLKGSGPGGGGMGNTIGVGALGTAGRGGGQSGYGTGVSRIKQRAERNINISVGQPVIMGSLSMDIIRRVIHSHRDQVKYCYSQELTRNPNLAGKVTVKFTISPTGYVQQASVANTTLNNTTVERCMTQKILTWKFPEPKGGGIVIVSYPFILKAD